MTMDPYRLLGIDRDATADQIHAAYRRRARQLHPDAGGTDGAEMARVNRAWRVLGDPVRRAAHDSAAAQAELRPGTPRAVRDDGHEVGVSLPAFLRLIVISTVVLSLVIFVAIFLIGFGRIGVAPQP